MLVDLVEILVTIEFLLLSVDFAHADFDSDEVTLRPPPHYQKITLEKHLENHGITTGTHQILTEDGYYLTLFNFFIENDLGRHNKTPVLLVNGLAADCASWFLKDIKETLPHYLLANKNDVWCVNLRGTRSSRRHKRYSVNSGDYWNFSWHENGISDLPPVIDYVTSYTKRPKIIGVAHSKGGTSFLVLLSKMPEYNKKMELFIGLAPAGAIIQLNEPITLSAVIILPYIPFQWLDSFLYAFPPRKAHDILGDICATNFLTNLICTHLVSFYFGYNPQQWRHKTVISVLSVTPVQNAVKDLRHYGQTRKSGNFREYDYGRKQNMKVYGKPKPPNYNTSNVMVPVTILYGLGDAIAPPEDVTYTNSLLPNSKMFRVPCGYFNHEDFFSGKDAEKCVYEKIIEVINETV